MTARDANRVWFPHLDFAGEPMREGEFREPYPMQEELAAPRQTAGVVTLLPVTQADRKAAHDYWLSLGEPNADTLTGARDDSAGVQAFAAHRIASTEKLVSALGFSGQMIGALLADPNSEAVKLNAKRALLQGNAALSGVSAS